MVAMIQFHRVSKSFDAGRTFAVCDLSLEIARGELFVMLGSSGCGKTTTLKMINGLIAPTRGTVRVAGQCVQQSNVLAIRRSIGYVFQRIGLFPHLTIEQNVEMVPRLLGWTRNRRRIRAEEVMRLVGLDLAQFRGRLPRQLSGGQQQRIGIARALAADPDCLLMDEPFGAVDALTRDTLQKTLLEIKHEFRKTIVFVTHDIFEALTIGDRIGVMHGGRLEQVDDKHTILTKPQTAFVKELFSRPRAQLTEVSNGLTTMG